MRHTNKRLPWIILFSVLIIYSSLSVLGIISFPTADKNIIQENNGTTSILSFDIQKTLTSLVLGISSVLCLVAVFFPGFQRTGLYKTLFEDNKESNTLIKVLQQLGYTDSQTRSIVYNLSYKARNAISGDEKQCGYKLIEIMIKYIEQYSNVRYGSENSAYFIHTMEAVHSDELCDMVEILRTLIRKKTKIEDINFLLAPKAGNPLLVRMLGEAFQVPTIVVKQKNEKSYGQVTDPLSRLRINYEGSWDVLSRASKCEDKLNGVLVDCNASGGKQLITIVEEFNQLIQNASIRIAPISQAFVLFRVDTSEDIDVKFSDLDAKLHRYFDLDEEIKALLYKSKITHTGLNRPFDITMIEDKNEAKMIIKSIKTHNKIKKEVKVDLIKNARGDEETKVNEVIQATAVAESSSVSNE